VACSLLGFYPAPAAPGFEPSAVDSVGVSTAAALSCAVAAVPESVDDEQKS